MWTCLLAKYIIIVLTCFYKSGLWENVGNFIIILCTLFVLIGSHIDELLEGPFCTMHFSTKVWYWATAIFCRFLSEFICSNDDDEWAWSEKSSLPCSFLSWNGLQWSLWNKMQWLYFVVCAFLKRRVVFMMFIHFVTIK